MRELQEAVKQEDFDKVRSLVEQYGVEKFYDVKVNNGEKDHIALFHYMIEKEKLCMVRFLVEKGWDVNRRDVDGDPSVFYAMSCSDEKIRKYLLKQGLDLDMKMSGGDTVMIMSSVMDEIGDIEWLFLNGADTSIKGHGDRDMLYYLSEPYLEYLLPLFLQEPDRWSEENLKVLKAKRLQYLMK